MNAIVGAGGDVGALREPVKAARQSSPQRAAVTPGTIASITGAVRPDGLDNVRAALALLTRDELDELRAAPATGPQLAPRFLLFLAHAAHWEIARRERRPLALRGPHSVIGREEFDIALPALGASLVAFRHSAHILALLAATAEALQDPSGHRSPLQAQSDASTAIAITPQHAGRRS